jgi:RHS repeat-associated protein
MGFDAYGQAQATMPSGEVFGYQAQWGGYTDRYSGFVLLTHRYYDSQTGRFVTRDPIGQAGGINEYGYVGGDPVNWGDPSGLKPGDKYPSRDAAGKAAIRDINPTSIKEDREYAGFIYKNGDKYTYTAPVPLSGPDGGALLDQNPNMPAGDYHTHGNCPKGRPNEYENFSPTDKLDNRINGWPGYLGTSQGKIKRYDPDPKKKGPGKVVVIGKGVR